MKQRLEATHFIEIYTHASRNKTYASAIGSIRNLDYDLNVTATSRYLRTIAIFKIKFHNK